MHIPRIAVCNPCRVLRGEAIPSQVGAQVSMIFWTRQVFTDEHGAPLKAGRLEFFLAGSSTPAQVFADAAHTVPLGTSVLLSDSGWPLTELHSSVALDVHASAYVGLVEGVPGYRLVQTFRWEPVPTAGGALVGMGAVSDLSALRDAPIADAYQVLGHSALGDCPARVFRWQEGSVLTDNSGTVVGSNLDAGGRWIWAPKGEIDCRTFGVLATGDAVNSRLATWLNYCESSGAIGLMSSGVFTVAPGSLDSSATIRVAKGASLTCTGEYTLGLYAPPSIAETFAGSGVKLILKGERHASNPVPGTTWDQTLGGWDEGGNVYIVCTSAGAYAWANAGHHTIETLAGETSVHTVTGDVSFAHLVGEGLASYTTNTTHKYETLSTSKLASRKSYAMTRTTGQVLLDSNVTLHNGANITAYVQSAGGTLYPAIGCKMTGGYSGMLNFIQGPNGIDVGYDRVESRYFADADGLVASYNASINAEAILDMCGSVSTVIVSRSGKILNGTIGGVTAASIDLDKVTCTGDITSTSLIAKDSTLSGNMTSLTSSVLTNCTVSSPQPVPVTYAKWTQVSMVGSTGLRSYGNMQFLDVTTAGNLVLIPNASGNLADVSWIGGKAGTISFDASQMQNVGSATASNVTIRNVACTAITSVNGGTKNWNVSTHSKICICDNGNVKRTRGPFSGVTTGGTTGTTYVRIDDLFTFNHNASSVYAPGTQLYINYISRKSPAMGDITTWVGFHWQPGLYMPGPTIHAGNLFNIPEVIGPGANIVLDGSIYA